MPGPLDGYRILDLSAVISGPFGTMILADPVSYTHLTLPTIELV